MGWNPLKISDLGAEDASRGTMRMFMALIIAGLAGVTTFGAWYVQKQAERSANRIVCFGDSLTECGGPGGRFSDYLADALPDCQIINKGMGGDTLERARNRFHHDVLALHPRIVVIELGANDFHNNDRDIKALQDDLEFMVNALHIRGVDVIIAGVFGDQFDKDGKIIPKVYKSGSTEFGQQIFELEITLSKRYGCTHIPNIQAELNEGEHWNDENHPSSKGNVLVAKRILPAIQALLQNDKSKK